MANPHKRLCLHHCPLSTCSDELVQSPTEDADYDEIPEEAPDSDGHNNDNTRGKPPLPLPNKTVSNGVMRGIDPSKEDTRDTFSPHKMEQTVIPTVPYTYAQVNKKGKDQVITSQPCQQPSDCNAQTY